MDRSHLVLEYQALVNETKRKFPDVKDAAERAITTSRNASLDLRKDGRHSDELLAPIELGCRTKVPKVVATSIGALQRLVGVGALTERLVPAALSMLGDAISAGLDSQLKILQVLLFILKYCQGIHGDVLSQLLLLCFRLHDSKVGIVSSTAAATLRQAVMMVFERLSVEAGPNGTATNDVLAEDANGPAGLSESVIQALSPDVSDAFWIFQDLCTLLSPPEVRKHQKQQSLSSRKVAHGGTVILQLRDLSKTFGLELIESILNGFSKEILQRLELLAVLRSSLCSLLAQSVQHTLDFAVTLRLIRLQYLVVRSYASRLPLETEVFLNTFISFALGENNAGRRPSVAVEGTPYWLRVMCMEALLGLFQSAKLTEHVWVTYDALDGHSDLLTKFIDALNRILSERPGQLGTSAEMHGLHVGALSSPSQTFSPTKEETYLDKGISVMTSAATMGVNTVSAIMSGDQTEGLDASACAMKVQCIEQHDKAEPPTIPEKNLYLLAVKAFNRIVSNVAGSQLISKSVVSACWTAFLATYSLLLKANISIDLFHETLDSLRDLMVVIGEVDLQTPKEAFYTALGRLALPASLINAAQQYQEHGQKPALTTAADALGLGATAPARRPSMSERNVACLQVIFDVIERTQDGIKDSWLRLLPVLEDANYILQPASRRSAPSGTPEMPSSPRIQRMSSYATHDSENIITSIASDRLQGIFSQTSSLSEISLRALVQAICDNNAELIKGRAGPEAATPTTPITPRADRSFDLTRAMTKGERAYRAHKSQYCVTLLDKVANTNLERFVADDELWRTITNHLFFIASHPDLSLESRVQAVQALLHMVQETLNRNEEPPAGEALTTQARALATLLRLVKADQDTNLDAELRAISLERLNSILEFAGHTLVDAWSVIFVALRTTCNENRSRAAPSLVRTAFVALNLICSDFASTLRDWPSCISCLSAFGSQHIDVNVSLSAIGLMWQMSDHLRNAPQGTASTELLVSLSKLCTDDRAEVRLSALQTLFRCISTLSVSDGVDDIVLALLEDFDSKAAQGENHAEWDETGSTILGEIGALVAAGDCLKDSEHAERVTALTSTWACKPGTKLCTASLELEARLDSAKSTAFERVSTLLKTQAEDSTLDQAKPGPFFTQDNLKALIGLLRRRATHDVASALDCAVLAVQYRLSPTYVTDVDALSPLQQAVLDLWVEVTAGSGLRLAVADRLLRLAFESRFRFVDITMRFGPSSKTTLKDVTFVALHKALLPKVQQLVLSEEKLLLHKSDEVLLGFIQVGATKTRQTMSG